MLLSRMTMVMGAHVKGNLTLPASQSISSNDLSGQAISARILFDEDGGFRQYKESSGSGLTSEFPPHWWSQHPDAGNPGDNYHVKITHNGTGTNRMVATDMAHDTWESIATDRIAYFTYGGTGGPNTDTSAYTIAWSDDGGTSTIGSYTFTLDLVNQTP